jgi:tripartite-type tricarboxylate transporter receptor subunit TctC
MRRFIDFVWQRRIALRTVPHLADISMTLPQVKTGTATGLAVSTARLSTLVPELPTMAEAGVRGYDIAGWFAAVVRRAHRSRSSTNCVKRLWS